MEILPPNGTEPTGSPQRIIDTEVRRLFSIGLDELPDVQQSLARSHLSNQPDWFHMEDKLAPILVTIVPD